MTTVNKLPLVDVGKLNAILEMFKKDNENKKIITAIKREENIVDFLKKTNSIKREYNEIKEKEKEKKEEEEKEKGTKKLRSEFSSSIQKEYSDYLNEYFKQKKFKVNNGK